jgi:hypothetical protein
VPDLDHARPPSDDGRDVGAEPLGAAIARPLRRVATASTFGRPSSG